MVGCCNSDAFRVSETYAATNRESVSLFYPLMPRLDAMGQLESSKPTPSQPSSQEEEHFQRGPEWVLASSPQWLIVAMRPAQPHDYSEAHTTQPKPQPCRLDGGGMTMRPSTAQSHQCCARLRGRTML